MTENSKWAKLASKQDILLLKEKEGFKFCISHLSKHFNIPDKRVGELLTFYGIEVERLSKNIRLTTEEFIRRAVEKHGDRYEYSLVEYVRSISKVKIICKEHGIFEQTPSAHLWRGGNCPACGREASGSKGRTTYDDFIKQCKEAHGNRYGYELVHKDFKSLSEKFTFICPQHGEFKQEGYSHRNGSGCERCSYDERGLNTRVSFEEFIRRAEKVHGSKYEYIEGSYTTINNPVSYICEIHGEVSQQASTHIKSQGCAKCFPKNTSYTTEEFINKVSEIHNNFYDYSKTVYKNRNNQKVIITCPFHGDFEQTPMSHLQRQGCGVCANIKSNINFKNRKEEFDINISKVIPCVLYLLKFVSENSFYYKIGISTNFPQRLTKLKGAHRKEVLVLLEINTNLFEAAKIESEVLSKYKYYNRGGEIPFGVDGSTECFNMSLPIQEIINNLEK